MSVYTRLANGAAADDPSAIAFASSEVGHISFLIYDGETEVHSFAQIGLASATAIDGPDVTPTRNGCTIVGIYGGDPSGAPSGTIGGTGTERVDTVTGLSTHIYVADHVQVTAAPISLNWTASVADEYAAFTLALSAAVASGGTGSGPAGLAVTM
jgi:hypothetical protein